jgi:hypothetical protein
MTDGGRRIDYAGNREAHIELVVTLIARGLDSRASSVSQRGLAAAAL